MFYEKPTQQSLFKIKMANGDGDIVESSVTSFATGHKTHPTKAEKLVTKQISKEKASNFKAQEALSIRDFTSMAKTKGISCVDLTVDVEAGAADAYIYADPACGQSIPKTFVVVQVTMASRQDKNGAHTVHKSTDELVQAVIDKQFIFVGLLYDEGECCGAILLTPYDRATIDKLDSKAANFSMKMVGKQNAQRIVEGSAYAAFLPHIYIWKDGAKCNAEQKLFFWNKISTYIANEGIQKYTPREFALMVVNFCVGSGSSDDSDSGSDSISGATASDSDDEDRCAPAATTTKHAQGRKRNRVVVSDEDS